MYQQHPDTFILKLRRSEVKLGNYSCTVNSLDMTEKDTATVVIGRLPPPPIFKPEPDRLSTSKRRIWVDLLLPD